ncbi:ABC transporter permease [Actinospica durhamensis]|uniref:ABC transporter permease n=1 Tax=Actinospica durhamensis TaxID=1508375 RepID=A0A941ER20_9ACTN|nr:ABC transporter permease [Actinospica durhamensis]MBR7834933.1 ABC transporter permease [Actinospica durhamensis]
MPEKNNDDAPVLLPTLGASLDQFVRSGGMPQREFTVKARTQREIVFRRFLKHRAAVTSLIVFLLVVLFAFVGPLLWNQSFNFMSNDIEVPPSGTHPFGTDSNGYDLFADVMHGTARTLEIALSVSIASTVIGTVYGAVSGYFRGWVDTVMMRIADLILTIPAIVVAIIVSDKLSASISSAWYFLAFILSALFWPVCARIVRAQVLSLREKEFVEAARALGAKDTRIIFRHIVPNCLGSIIVVLTLTVANTVLVETALSFLGFGVRPPDTSLGTLVSNGQTAIQDGFPWLFYFPALFIILIVLTINFIGDGLRDAFDPQQTRVRA